MELELLNIESIVMSEEQYQKCLSWSLERGLTLDPRIERKKVHGVYGMYAMESIPTDTIIASFPIKEQIPHGKKTDFPKNTPDEVKVMYAAAVELSKGESSIYYGCVSMFETLQELKEHSFYFFTEAEFKWIQKLNPLLFRLALEQRNRIDVAKATIKKLNPKLDSNFVIQAILNYYSRAWHGGVGFLPILDLFNHSDRKGNTLIKPAGGTNLAHSTRIAYKKGEQVFVSYSRHDAAVFALNYDYFDPEGVHFIDYSLRALHSIRTGIKQKVFELIRVEYGGQFFDMNGVRHFKIAAKNLHFLENAPSFKLITYFKMVIQIEGGLNKQTVNDQLVLESLLATMNAFISAIKVDQFDLKDLPEKLHRFYYLSQKEQKMLLSNRDWVIDNFTM
jgi:hypothetical protein